MYVFTSESVGPGHPDKIADQISDVILDFCLSQNPDARVACEVLVTTNLVIVAGEISKVVVNHGDVDSIIRNFIKNKGYSQHGFQWQDLRIESYLHQQSCEIYDCVDGAKVDLLCSPSPDNEPDNILHSNCINPALVCPKKSPLVIGAGDQGIMFGYAVDETPTLMPAPIYYAHKLLLAINRDRLLGKIPEILADGKSQISCIYDSKWGYAPPIGIDSIVLSLNHTCKLNLSQVTEIGMHYIKKVIPSYLLTNKTKYYINSSGSFIQGGPMVDVGLTGRKIIVDTYGGAVAHGGGAFSGKDATKVDRSGAYLARYLAKNIVASKITRCCTIQISYAIGISKPISLFLDFHGTSKASESEVATELFSLIDMTPAGIIQRFKLNTPLYQNTAFGGHFGRDSEFGGDFPWEQLDFPINI